MTSYLVEYMANTIAVLIPFITLAAFVASLIMFAKTKGTTDALRIAAENYKTLADSYKETIEQLEYKRDCCEDEKQELFNQLAMQKQAMEIAIDEIVEGLLRAGVERPKGKS